MKLKIIEAPSNLGYSNSNTSKFPSYLKKCGLNKMLKTCGFDYENMGEIKNIKKDNKYLSDNTCKYVDQVEKYCQKLSDMTKKSINDDNNFILTIGGDHSIAIGSIAGILQKRKKMGVIWLDAHSDIHTPKTTMTGWIYGMPAAVVCGYGDKKLTEIFNNRFVNPKKLCMLATQYIDEGEDKNIKKYGVNLISMDEVISQGVAKSIEKAISIVSKDTDYVHLSLDLDVIDEQYAPGTTESNKGQLTYREIKYICKKLGEKKIVSSMDIVEGDPIKDKNQETAKLSIELIANVLGNSFSEYDSYITKNRIE